MPRSVRFGRRWRPAAAASGVLTLLLAPAVVANAQNAAASPSLPPVSSMTIAQIHEALTKGRTTCAEMVRAELDRIAAYDRQGVRTSML